MENKVNVEKANGIKSIFTVQCTANNVRYIIVNINLLMT